MKRAAPECLPLSSLNALEYCPRRFYYEYVQGDMLDNEYVVAGSLLHEQVDLPGFQHGKQGELQVRRLYLHSEHLHLTGFADLVEEQEGQIVPVEYKRGKEGRWLNDHIQLCAQALCLEELLPEQAPLPTGAIFYAGSHKRVSIPLTDTLRAKTHALIAQGLQLAESDVIPAPLEGKQAARCRDCSLQPLCLPEEVLHLQKREQNDAHTLSY